MVAIVDNITSAIDAATQALASATIGDKKEETNAETKTDAKTEDKADTSNAAAEGKRLYIGNLAYSTTEEQLKEFFKAYKVESVSIPTNPRTARAVGYAFVDVSTKEEAERAIPDLSGKEILDRKVSVQVARRPGTSGEGNAGGEGRYRYYGRPRRGRGGMRGRGRGRGGRRRMDSTRRDTIGTTATADTAGEEATAPTAAATTTEATAYTGNSEGNKQYRPYQGRPERKKRGPPENGVPSTTKVMVANLPYGLTEEKLKELFQAYQPESAKIALRPIPRFMVRKLQARNEPRKGRGFGFVTLPSEELQKKAVDEMNGKTVEGREIAVKIAIDNPRPEGEENQSPTEKTEEGAKSTENSNAKTAEGKEAESKAKEENAIPVLAS